MGAPSPERGSVGSEVGPRILKNSRFNLIRTILTVPITLLLTPYIFRHLGKEEFGLWALVSVISSYAQLSDFGITESLIKFMAEFHARQEVRRLNQLVNTALVSYLVLSAVFCTLFLLLLPLVVTQILQIPERLADQATMVFSVAILLFFVNMLMGVFGSLIVGFQRMGYTNAIALATTLMTAAGTFFFLDRGYGLSGLVYNNALATLMVAVANLVIAWRLFPQMRLNPLRHFSREMLFRMLGFSWKVQVSNITQLMIFQIDRVLLSHYLGLEAVSVYEVANRIASQVRALIISVFTPMIPAASALQAGNEHGRITGLYRRSLKYMAIAAIPLSCLVISLAHPFIRTWMGAGFESSALTLQLLMAAYLLNLLTGPGAFILSGINKPQVGMRSSILAGVCNLSICFVLVQWIGYFGIVAGIFTSIAISGFYFVIMVNRHIDGLDWQLYRHVLVRPLIVGGVLTASTLALYAQLPFLGYPLLIAVALAFSLLTGMALVQGNYLDEFDRATMRKLVPWGGRL